MVRIDWQGIDKKETVKIKNKKKRLICLLYQHIFTYVYPLFIPCVKFFEYIIVAAAV